MRWWPERGNDFLLPYTTGLEGKERERCRESGFNAETGMYENLMKTDIVAPMAALPTQYVSHWFDQCD